MNWLMAACVVLMTLVLSVQHVIADDKPARPQFRVVAMAESGGVHLPYTVIAARKWLNQLAAENNFTVDYIENADKIDDAFLSHYQ